MRSKKEKLKELNSLLDAFDMAKGPELLTGVDRISGKQNNQLRNYRKKMIKLFNSFTPERQEEELQAFRDKIKETDQHEQGPKEEQV